jgi:glycine/D-amino acid oxidase-like deaminating enzyme
VSVLNAPLFIHLFGSSFRVKTQKLTSLLDETLFAEKPRQVAHHSHTHEAADVAIVGAGIAGLATALALYRKLPTIKVVVLSPSLGHPALGQGFGSNQPAIASHPHFSKDNNILSQWTNFCIPENDQALNTACAVNPAIAVARGRWQVAQSIEHAIDLQARINVFNANVDRKFHAQWRAGVTEFGAMWLPSAWAVSPSLLQAVWTKQLTDLGCLFVDTYVRKFEVGSRIVLQYEIEQKIEYIEANKIVLCNPASLHDVLHHQQKEITLSAWLPLVQWPGQSQKEQSTQRSALFGTATVQNESYSIALGGNEWLVRDEQETATSPYRGDRWHTPDRLPYVGPMFDASSIASRAMQFWKNDLLTLPVQQNLFINSAHGTRGLLSGIAGASLVADMLLGVNTSLPQTLVAALNPNRYIRRALREHFRHLQSSNKIL